MMMGHALLRVKSNLCRNAAKASTTACRLATLLLDLEAHREHRQTKPIMLMAGCDQNHSGKAKQCRLPGQGQPLWWAAPFSSAQGPGCMFPNASSRRPNHADTICEGCLEAPGACGSVSAMRTPGCHHASSPKPSRAGKQKIHLLAGT